MNDTFVYRLSFLKNDEIDEGYKATVTLNIILYLRSTFLLIPHLKIRIVKKLPPLGNPHLANFL